MIKTKVNLARNPAAGSEEPGNAVPLADRVKFLKGTSLFSTFDKEHIQDIAWVISERHARTGDWLCREGEKGEELYVIYRGHVDVVVKKDSGPDVVYTAGPGEVLGEMSVLGHIPRTAGLRARGDTHLFVIKGPHFIQLLRENPNMALAVIELLVQRLTS